MELRQLRHFAALAHALNFRRAAEAVKIAQPALSISIRKLEIEIGVKLFERRTREVALTEAGRVALPAALATLEVAQETIRLAQAVEKGESGRLIVGVVAGATYRLLPGTLPRFKAAFPNIEIQLLESTSRRIVDDVLERKVDVGIVRSPLSSQSSCQIIQVEDDQLVAILPPSHRLSARKNIDLNDLSQDAFVMYSYSQAPSLHAVVSFACQNTGFAPRISQEAIQLQTIASLVRSGFGVALIPSACIASIGNDLAVCRIRDAGTSLSVGLAVVMNPRSQSNLVKHFVACLQSAI